MSLSEKRVVYVLAAVLPIIVRVLIGFQPCDDAFITYRYAHNLAANGQFTFNLGTSVFGCTTLGYALALSGLNLLGMPIIAASWLLTLLGEMASALLLARIALSKGRKPASGR